MYCVTITDAHLDTLQWVSLIYYLRETNRDNGLVADKTLPGSPASIAAVGMALATAPVVVEREIITREEAAAIVLKKLRFFRDSPQGPEPDATGYKGFYYHFLDMKSGRRVWDCELSTMDTGFLIAGMLTAAAYFDGKDSIERAIRETVEFLYRRVDWRWATNGGAAITHGWKPETGFIPYTYEGYDEGLLLYVLALGSPTFSLGPESYAAWTPTDQAGRKSTTGNISTPGPLFTHQLSHLFIDFRGRQRRNHQAPQADRLLRELPTSHLHPARVRDQEPEWIRRVWRDLLGVHPQATVLVDGPERRRQQSIRTRSSTTSPEGRRSAQTTEPSHPGWWSPRCRSPRRSSCRRSSTSIPLTSG